MVAAVIKVVIVINNSLDCTHFVDAVVAVLRKCFMIEYQIALVDASLLLFKCLTFRHQVVNKISPYI
jgi:hypothetical protein